MQNPYIDYRARLRPFDNNMEYLLGGNEVWSSPTVPIDKSQTVSVPLLSILRHTNGIVWMYTPQIEERTSMNYVTTDISQANQDFHNYGGTKATTISVSGQFTADTYENAVYCLAVMHFLRIMNKNDFGTKTQTPGLPPPLLLFSAYGRFRYDDVPVILSNYSASQPDNVDYIDVPTVGDGVLFSNKSVRTSNRADINKVPMIFTITVELTVQKTPKQLRDNFNLNDFKTGKLLKNRGSGWV